MGGENEGQHGIMSKFLKLGLTSPKISIEDRKSIKAKDEELNFSGGLHKEKVKKLIL